MESVPSSQYTPTSVENYIRNIHLHQSRARFVSWIIAFIFISLVLITLLLLWATLSKEQGTPDLKNDTQEFIEAVEEELN